MKVALLTGSDRVADAGSDAVIPKPFTIEQLINGWRNGFPGPAREP